MLVRTIASVFVISALAVGQSAPQAFVKTPQLPPVVASSDAQASAVVSQAINAAGGLQVLLTVQDYTATGQITYYWAGDSVQGQATLRGRGLDQSRLDANLPEGTRSWAVSHGNGTMRKADGTEKPIAGHNAISLGALTLPGLYLVLASTSPSTTVSTLGTEQYNGVAAIHVRVQRHYPAAQDPQGVLAQLTTRDFFIDPSTYLVVGTEFMTHPTKTFTVSLPEDIYFSNYQRVNGVMVPFAAAETINGQKIWSLQLSSIQFNSGLSDADFSLP